MFRNLAEDITFILIKNKIVDIEEREVYVYGIEVILLNAILLIILSGISFLFGALYHLLAFGLFFVPLRIFAGGYHAETSEKCLAQSISAYVITHIIIKVFPFIYRSIFAIMALIIFSLIIFVLAPLVNKNNDLNENQYKRNRILVRILLAFNLALFGYCYLNDLVFASSGLIFIGLVSILLLVGKLKRFK